MTHYIKIPATEKAINAAQVLLRATGQKQDQPPFAIAAQGNGKTIYIWGGNGAYPSGGWNPIEGSVRPSFNDTITDLTYLFKDEETEAVLESLGDNIIPKERFRVRITKETTAVGCQTFRNKDILYIADLVRKRI